MKKYYLHDGKTQIGPLDLQEVRDRKISKDTYVWTDELPNWEKAGNIPELKYIISREPPPLAKSPPEFKPDQAPTEYIASKKRKRSLLYILSALAFLFVIWVIAYALRSETKGFFSGASKPDSTYVEQQKVIDAIQDLSIKNRALRNNWNKFIKTEANEYSKSKLGGISDLKIKLINTSFYPLDEVRVRINYLKVNGNIFKQEELIFTQIPAKSFKVLDAKGSSRGNAITQSITRVQAKSFKFCFDSTLVVKANSVDPYWCDK